MTVTLGCYSHLELILPASLARWRTTRDTVAIAEKIAGMITVTA